jgi:hypothetical protein
MGSSTALAVFYVDSELSPNWGEVAQGVYVADGRMAEHFVGLHLPLTPKDSHLLVSTECRQG